VILTQAAIAAFTWGRPVTRLARMASDFDASEFVDEDYRAPQASPSPGAEGESRAPTREEVDTRVNEMQQKLAELKRAQTDLERERATLEELRRRQTEFTQGRAEMIQHLTRGLGILDEKELAARRQVEQMSKILAELRTALDRIQSIHEETWTKETLEVDLTRANTVIENARMEWNSALVKLPFLSGEGRPEAAEGSGPGAGDIEQLVRQQNYAELCKLGLALTWPLALAGLAIFLVLLMRG
jgi:small-conductance mechanosensitive channel